MLVVMLSLMTAGLAVAGGATYSLSLAQLDERVDAELRQEVEELTELARAGPDGDGGQPYTDLDALFFDFLQNSVSGAFESSMGIIDGEVVYVSGGQRTFAIGAPEVLEVVERETRPGLSVMRDVSVDGHDLRLVITSVVLPDEPANGTLVVGIDVGSQRDELVDSMTTYALVALATLLLAAVAVYVVSGRLLRPLTELRGATSAIDADDLTRRVSVQGADNDVAQLAVTFNQMLDRLESGFTDQRRFLDDAAHELRTPLTILRGNLELIDAADPEDVSQTKDLVLDELDRMQRLVDDLLLLAKAKRPDFVTQAPVDAVELLEELMGRVRLLGDRTWSRGAQASGQVSVDRQRLLQAVVQLCANSVKFTRPTDTITVSTRWAMPDSTVAAVEPTLRTECFVVSVQDTGAGIPPDQLPRIFERFARADHTAQIEGSGLGLAIVDAIARGHGGVVTVQSVEDLGSTFRIWLPVTRAPAPAAQDRGHDHAHV